MVLELMFLPVHFDISEANASHSTGYLTDWPYRCSTTFLIPLDNIKSECSRRHQSNGGLNFKVELNGLNEVNETDYLVLLLVVSSG